MLTRGPVPFIGPRTQGDMAPYVIDVGVTQLITVQSYLIIGLGEDAAVLRHDAVVRKERRYHVYKVAPVDLSDTEPNRTNGNAPQLCLRLAMADRTVGAPGNDGQEMLELPRSCA